MTKKRLIKIYVTHNRNEYSQIHIPSDINEIQLKAVLRDLGHISSFRQSYLNTRVWLEDPKSTNLKEICIDAYRSLNDLGIKEKSLIFIQDSEEPSPYRINYGSRNYLYGCPMASSVKDAVNQAERYSDSDSIVKTGSIIELD